MGGSLLVLPGWWDLDNNPCPFQGPSSYIFLRGEGLVLRRSADQVGVTVNPDLLGTKLLVEDHCSRPPSRGSHSRHMTRGLRLLLRVIFLHQSRPSNGQVFLVRVQTSPSTSDGARVGSTSVVLQVAWRRRVHVQLGRPLCGSVVRRPETWTRPELLPAAPDLLGGEYGEW